MSTRITMTTTGLFKILAFSVVTFSFFTHSVQADETSSTLQISAEVPYFGQSPPPANQAGSLPLNFPEPLPVFGSASFSGTAFKGAKVHILRNGTQAGIAEADQLSKFSATIGGISPGNHTFLIFAENGADKSAPISVSLIIEKGVVVSVNQITLSLLPLPPVPKKGKEEALNLGRLIPKPASETQVKALPALPADVNGDLRVNVVDFSIMASWFRKVFPPKSVDLNNDGRVSLVDFSILASRWTG